MASKEIEKFIKSQPADVQKPLRSFRKLLLSHVPNAEERMLYKVPSVCHAGVPLVAYGARKNGCSFYTMSPKICKTMQEDLKGLKVSVATIHFTKDSPLPDGLVKKIISARLEEVAEKKRSKTPKNKRAREAIGSGCC